jgi:hypothetical protein
MEMAMAAGTATARRTENLPLGWGAPMSVDRGES